MSRDILAEAARRHAHALPGHTLLAAEPSAIPVSVLTVDVLAEQCEDLEASQKYALRAMLNGINTVEDLQLFLGLDAVDTAHTVAALLDAEYIDYRPPENGGARLLTLLPAGQEAARHAQLRRPTSAPVQVVYNRLTKTLTQWRKNSLRRAVSAKSDPGRILMPPASSMTVQLEDLSAAAVADALDQRRGAFRILGVSGVTENRNFYRDAILLVYKDVDSNTLRLGVEVDGAWSEVHTAALEAIGAVERLGLKAAASETPHEPVAESGTRLTRDEVITLQTALAEGETPGDGEADVLTRAAIRWLGVYEHPQWLDDAVANSKGRLLIISPWITRSVVTAQFVNRVERLAKTADVTLFWGFGDNKKTDAGALADLHAAARRPNRLAVVKVSDTHAKVLVSDGYYIKTSFNWLSFRGDPSREYRQEEGDLVQDGVLADRAYDKYMTENCGLALEVVGTLPDRYSGFVGPQAIRSTAPPAPAVASRQSRQQPARAKPPVRAKKPKDSHDAFKKFSVGQTLSGAVKSLTDYGAFVTVGDVDGLIHISRLARRRLEHPSEVVSVGQTVTVMVVDVDLERGRLSLALKTTGT